MLTTARRYCASITSCTECELDTDCKCIFERAPQYLPDEDIRFTVEFLDAWAKENLTLTRGQNFFNHNAEAKRCEAYPNIPDVRPCDYDESVNFPARCCRFEYCDDCRKEYWEEPVE